MERKDILKQVNDIFIDTLDNPEIVITETTAAADVEEWDSLTHIQLVVATEKHFVVEVNAQFFDNNAIASSGIIKNVVNGIATTLAIAP